MLAHKEMFSLNEVQKRTHQLCHSRPAVTTFLIKRHPYRTPQDAHIEMLDLSAEPKRWTNDITSGLRRLLVNAKGLLELNRAG